MTPRAAYSSSLPPMTVMREVSFSRMMNSLPRAGRMALKAWGTTIKRMVWK